MTEEYKKFSEDHRWVQSNYFKMMANSQNLNTRLSNLICNIISSLEKVNLAEGFYFKEYYLVSKGKYMNQDEKERA